MEHTPKLEEVLSDLDSSDVTCVSKAMIESADLIANLRNESLFLLRKKLHQVLAKSVFDPEFRATVFWVLSKHPSELDLEASVEFLKLNGKTLHPLAIRQAAVLADEFLIRSDRNMISGSLCNLSYIRKMLDDFPEILADFDELSRLVEIKIRGQNSGNQQH